MKTYYPIGSVVKLASPEGRRFLIAGYLPQGPDGKVYDYFGVPFPLGITGGAQYICFRHSAITEVLHRGCSDESCQKLLDDFTALGENLTAAAQLLRAEKTRKTGE